MGKLFKREYIENLYKNLPFLLDVVKDANPRVLSEVAPSALKAFILQKGKASKKIPFKTETTPIYNLDYDLKKNKIMSIYELAKKKQWNVSKDINWSQKFDPFSPDLMLLPDTMIPIRDTRYWRLLKKNEKNEQKLSMMSWALSQFLHGEQAALFVASQVTTEVENLEAKLFGATQVMDEARHVEVFAKYINEKLGKMYPVNDNLYAIIDATMAATDWDFRFLAMQIMIEGLALGSFATIRNVTKDPLLKEILKYVINDEARHVHYGVVSLKDFYSNPDLCPVKKRKEREEWAFEISRLLKNRFLAHEFYDEYYGHLMSRRKWDQIVDQSSLLKTFRASMFKRIMPNLRRVGLLSENIKPSYKKIGLMRFADEKSSDKMKEDEFLN